MSCLTHTTSVRSMALWLLAALAGGCATTASDIHGWGEDGKFSRIRQALRKTPSTAVRVAAAEEMGQVTNPKQIPDLVALSQDVAPEVRLQAVQGLGQLAGAQVYSAVLQRTGDDNAAVARAAERILTTWSDESVDFVLRALSDRSYRVRAAAVQMLARFKFRRVGRAVCDKARSDDNALVRREAAKSLGNMRYPGCNMTLYRLKTSDAATEVQLEAERALAKIGRNVMNIKLVVIPPRLGDGIKLDTLVPELCRKVRQERLCDVTQAKTSGEAEADLASETLRLAREQKADQAVYSLVERDANRLKVRVVRLAVASGKILQEEKLTGYEARSDELVNKITTLFVQRFCAGNR